MSSQKPTKTEVKERILGYITGAFGLVAALAWNDAVRALIDSVYKADKDSVAAQFIYAIVISVIVVIITVYLSKIVIREEKK